MSLTTRPDLARRLAAACGAVLLLLGTAACGNGGDGGNGGATGPTGERGGPQTRQDGPGGGRPPGVNGKVAAVDGSTAQVQGVDGQVAVTWTGSTSFTTEVGAALSDVKVGDCVAVGTGEQPSSDSTPSTEVTAASVRIIERTDGSCGPTVRGPAGPDGSGPQSYGGPPPGAGGGPRPQVRVGGAIGEVTAVSATGFTVDSIVPGESGSDTRAVQVSVGAGTTYTTTAKGAASDVKVGVCVVAGGTTDDTGAVTAKTIAVSQPQDGQCGGFMRFKSDGGDGGGASTQES